MKKTSQKWAVLLAGLVGCAGCFAHNGEEHGNHDAQHGGFVMMYEDLHFELAAASMGGVEVYYTDALREQLPAATVSDVVVEIERTDGSTEYLDMAISSDGGFWTGASKPITSADDIIRVGFVFQDNPLVLDVPFSAMARPVASEETEVSMPVMDHSTMGNMPAGTDHSSH